MNLLILGLPSVGFKELLVIGGLFLLFFGNRLPNLMRNLGRGVTGFKKGLQEGREESDDDSPIAGGKQ